MPVMSCQSDGKKGFKWGEGGVCFTGADARARASAVGRAVHARRGAAKAEEIEAEVALMDESQLAIVLKMLPPAPDELRTAQVQKSEDDRSRVTIKKVDDELQVVWGEIYVPNVPDAHGHFMSPREVQKMAYRTLADALRCGMGGGDFQGHDTQHDNVRCEDVLVENFVAREGDPDFMPGAWVVALHIPDRERWLRVKNGELNGFSMQASVLKETCRVEVDIPEFVEGETVSTSTGELHPHRFGVRFSAEGEFLGGETTVDAPPRGIGQHSHRIVRGSLTEPGGEDDHTHRFALLDKMFPAGTLGEQAIRWRADVS